MEIVTWVLEGDLEHRDTLGNTGIRLTPVPVTDLRRDGRRPSRRRLRSKK
jgi:hypothetical protein